MQLKLTGCRDWLIVGKRESGIQDRTVRELVREFSEIGIVIRVKHGTAFAVVGDPDIYGCVAMRMFVLELKNEDGKLTKIQAHRLIEFKRAGAIIGAIQSPEEAVAIIREGIGLR